MRFPDPVDAAERMWMRLRKWSPRVDHFSRAIDRFWDTQGGLLSAGISYYAFFAAFALLLAAFSGLGFVLDANSKVLETVEEWLTTNLPTIDVSQIVSARGTVGIIALIGFIITGIAWVQALRSSVRAVWRLEPEPGHPILRWLVDLGVLAALGILLAVTLGIGTIVETGLNWTVNASVGDGYGWIATFGEVFVGMAINTVLATALLTVLPRLAMRPARVLFPAIWVAVGLELIKTVGRFYITRVEHNPAYQLVTGTVGLLVFLQLFNQTLMFAAAWTATSRRGKVIDLSARPPTVVADDPE
ncbi:YihY/virulence factor BrkB family protein [Phytomonospora endophytica]|uniref:Membrane protein n=1 Tax=Phytomonospora endophytica TaxID=714109 RepID=A0A841FHM4_9ACTN|nr:YhjD/YihY/BrkB family envelope integrity protein [Phytomonospora endophytica]MBB6033348.1 membrane protein [Phytomonospora endophytica]GIG71513.1 hypothetical protein Pen01_78080 [Phytomonospora endophytica]